MNIVNHPLCTAFIGAPSDMPHTCDALPVRYESTPDGIFAQSFWRPDGNELADIINGGCVVLNVRAIGRQHPVVAVTATSDQNDIKGRKIGTIVAEDGCWIANSSFDLKGLPDGTLSVYAMASEPTNEHLMRHETSCGPTDADRFQVLMRAFDNPDGPEAAEIEKVHEGDKPDDMTPSTYARMCLDAAITKLKGQ